MLYAILLVSTPTSIPNTATTHHWLQEDITSFLDVQPVQLFEVLKLLSIQRDNLLDPEAPVADVVTRFFDQPLSSPEKCILLNNITLYIRHVFTRSPLSEDLITTISHFIPKLVLNLPITTEFLAFACCYSLAQVTMEKGCNRLYFAKRRLVQLFQQKLQEHASVWPNRSVVDFARDYCSDSTSTADLSQQLSSMFDHLFLSTSPVDESYLMAAVETLIDDVKSDSPLVTLTAEGYFGSFVTFVGRCDELGVHSAEVMRKLASYLLIQCEENRELWSHVQSITLPETAGTSPVHLPCTPHTAPGTGGPKLPLHQRAAQKLRTLSWLMLTISSSAGPPNSSTHSDLQGNPQ